MTETYTADDDAYFSSYADTGIHEDMLSDRARTNAYREAIMKNYERIRGKVVIDVGAGTGILGLFCAQAGAKRVYSVEASSMADQITLIAKENGLSDKIVVVNSKVEEAKIPEKVDVIVSEWMGYGLLHESMLPSVLFARDTWLKPGGMMLPERAVMYFAPFSHDEQMEDRLAFWNEVDELYKVKMTAIKPYARQCMTKHVSVRTLQPEILQSHGTAVCDLDLNTVPVEGVRHVDSKMKMECFGKSQLSGFVMWFKVTFPSGVELNTSPYHEPTHWQQCVFCLKEPLSVQQGSIIQGTIKVSENTVCNRFLDFLMDYSIDGKNNRQSFWKMDLVD